MLQAIIDKIHKKEVKIAVLGLGYVGLPLAVEFAKKGFVCFGIDKDKDRVNNVKKLIPYILDVPIEEIRQVVNNKKLIPTTTFSCLKEADVAIICVPTPLKRKYEPNIKYIISAVKEIAKYLHKDQLIILESTTYPGTTDEVIQPILEKNKLVCGKDFYLAFSPERIDPGNDKFPVHKIPKVVGGITPDAAKLVKELYENIITSVVVVSSTRVAETVKLLENTFRLINIGMINELAMMAHKMNIDIWEVVDAAKTKPFGFMPFYPGPGVGGHCIPKDPLYLYWKAKHHGFKSKFIKLASDINQSMPRYIVHRIKQKVGELKGKQILIIGVTYKKDVKDLRKSPALDLIEALEEEKAKVSYHDHLIPYLKYNGIDLKSKELTDMLLSQIDCVVIVAEHAAVDYDYLLENSKLVFDTRNVYKNVNSKKLIRL
jgi:UDP-N-acetyl-D-glucosamine dehydrogenase